MSGGLGNTRTGFSTVNPPTTIYRKEITDGLGGRFAVVGKHIYVALVSSTASDAGPQPGLVAIDFDGFYTGGAHIESLRSEKVEITKSLSVGDDLTLHGDAEIGGSMSVGGSVSVSGGISAAYGTVPVGAVMPFAGSAAPTGWLLCDGDSVSSTNYLQLHSVISNTYGGTAYTGAAGLNFNLPDLQQRIPVGRDPNYSQVAGEDDYNLESLGSSGGNREHSLTRFEIPPHTHQFGTGTANIQTGSGTTVLDNQAPFTDYIRDTNLAGGGGNAVGENGDGTGSAAPHTNMQPYLVMNYIIYAGA